MSGLTVSNALDALAGKVLVRLGNHQAALTSNRPDVAARLAPGKRARDLPALLGSVFTLCSHAHRFTATRAVASAMGQPDPVNQADVHALQIATLRDQVLRITHDWPAQLPGVSSTAPATMLSSCPLWRRELSPAEQLADLPLWLEHKWLGMPVQHWLAAHTANPIGWAAQWCHGSTGPAARLLRSQCASSESLTTPHKPLDLLHDAANAMPRLARDMADTPGFCSRPNWQGGVPDTGPWTRHADAQGVPAHNAWMRFVSRVTDVLHLAGPQGAAWLTHGTLALGPREGMAWTEMARGLLVHWVRLEPSAAGEDTRVAACRVLAPTEWNFHPHGVLAQALNALSGPDRSTDTRTDDARRLAIAFDPCVALEICADMTNVNTAATSGAQHA